MQKFENVDILACLDAVMKQNTGFYQSDFDIDREIIAKTAASASKEDKTLLWFCRPSGTHCFRERDVFLKGPKLRHTPVCKRRKATSSNRHLAVADFLENDEGKINQYK